MFRKRMRLFCLSGLMLFLFLLQFHGLAWAATEPMLPHRCTSCHFLVGMDDPLIAAGATANCISCHDGTGSTFVVATATGQFLGTHVHMANPNCIDCHDPHAVSSETAAATHGLRHRQRMLGSRIPDSGVQGGERVWQGVTFCNVCHNNPAAPVGPQRLRSAGGVTRNFLSYYENSLHGLGLGAILPPRPNVACLHCHEPHASENVRLLLDGMEDRGQCLRCHSDTTFGGTTLSPLDTVFSDSLFALFGGNQTATYLSGQRRWTSTTTFANLNAGLGATVANAGNGSLYVLAGGNTVAFRRYDLAANTLTDLAPITAAVGAGGSAVFARVPGDGTLYIYAFIGNNTTTFVRYNVTTNAWAAQAVAPAAVGAGASLVWTGGDYIYAFRGGGTTAFWRYRLSTNAWNAVGTFPAITGGVPAVAPAAVGAGGKLIWTGGDFIYAFRGNNTNAFWRYQISANSWNPTTGHSPAITGGLPAVLPENVNEGSSQATVAGGSFIYAFTGSGSRNVYYYELSADMWKTATLAPHPAGNGAVLSGTGYFFSHPINSIPPTRVTAAGVPRPGWAANTYRTDGMLTCYDCHDVHGNLASSAFPLSSRAHSSLRATRGIEASPWPFPDSQPRNTIANPGIGVSVTSAAWPSHIFTVSGGVYNRFYSFDLVNRIRRELRPLPLAPGDGSRIVWDGSGDRLYLMAGGGSNAFLSYSINNNTWTTLASPGISAAGANLVYGGGEQLFALLGGGQAFMRYDTATNTWTAMANTPAAVGSGASLVHTGGNHIFAFQGGTATFWRYSISANTWTAMTAAPATTGSGANLVHAGGDHIFALRGANTATLWRYNITLNTWTAMAAAPANMGAGSSLTYPAGGFHLYASQGDSGLVYQYNLRTNSWTALAAAPSAFGDGAGLVWGGADFLWVVHGGGVAFSRYSQVRNTWEAFPADLPTPAVGSGGAITYAGANFFYAFRGAGSAAFARYAMGTADGGAVNAWTNVATAPAAPGAGAALAWDEGNAIFALRGANTNTFWRYDITPNTWTAVYAAPGNVGTGGSLVWAGGNYAFAMQGGETNGFWRYVQSRNQWDVLAPLPVVPGAGAELAYPGEGSYVYALIGGGTNQLWRYSMTHNSWSRVSDAPVNFTTGSALAFGGGDYLYALQGGTSTILRYSVHANSWSASHGLPSNAIFGTGGSIAAVNEPIVYSFPGGSTNFLRYRPRTNRWLGLQPAPLAAGAGASLTWAGGGDIYALRGGTTAAFWRYNYIDNSWTALTSAPATPAAGAALAWAGGDHIFAFQGGTTAFWRYSISANTWAAMAVAPAAVAAGGSLVYPGFGDFIYAFRGGTTAFWRYSISANTWTAMAVAPGTAGAGASLSYPGFGNFIYAVGGAGTSTFWRYNITNDTWAAVATATPAGTPANVNAGGAMAWTSGDFIFAFQGGTTAFWRYSISGNSWTVMAAAPLTTEAGAALTWTGGDNVFAFRGGTATFWRYSISGNSWTAMAAAPANVTTGAALHYPGRGDFIYALQGGTTTFWRYQISTNTWTAMAVAPVAAAAGSSLVSDGRHMIWASLGGTNYRRYDISSNTWSAFPTGTSLTTVGAGGGLAYGKDETLFVLHGGTTATFSLFNPRNTTTSGLTTAGAAVPAAVGAGGGIVWTGGNTLYVMRGNNTNGFSAYRMSGNTWTETGTPNTIGTNSGNRIAAVSNQLFVLRGFESNEMWRYDIGGNRWNSATGLGDTPAPLSFRETWVDYEYQLCLKCHSGVNVSRPPGQTDIARVINPMHASSHPILVPTENRFADVETMPAPWNQQENSEVHPASRRHDTMACGACHSSHRNIVRGGRKVQPDPTGPHGSNIRGMLTDRLEVRSVGGGFEVPFCTTCHRATMYAQAQVTGVRGSRFPDHTLDDHMTANGCFECHIGGGPSASGRTQAFYSYIHGVSIYRAPSAALRGPVHAFLFGDGHRYVESVGMNCWTEDTCGDKHTPEAVSGELP